VLSLVRHQLQLPFSGQTYSDSIFLADCNVQNLPIEKNDVAMFFSDTGFAGVFPLVNSRHRIVGGIRDREPSISPLILDDIRPLFKQRSQLPDLNVSDCQWI
jgi:hypothetical protein